MAPDPTPNADDPATTLPDPFTRQTAPPRPEEENPSDAPERAASNEGDGTQAS